MKKLSITFLLLAALACTHTTDPVSAPDGESISISAVDGSSIIFNQTGRTIHYWMVNREVLASINYTLSRCSDSPDRLEPKELAVIKIDEIYENEPGDEVVLFWWTPGRVLENDCYEAALVSSKVLQYDEYHEKIIYLAGFID